MKRPVLAIVVAAAAGIVLAGDVGPARLKQFQRDLPLIEALVEQGIALSGEEDPLKRAQTCNVVAEALVQAIQQSVMERDPQQTSALGKHLEAVLVQGVAGNLNLARMPMAENVSPENLERIGQEVLRVTQPVANPATTDQKIMQSATAAVTQGRLAVQKAIDASKAPSTAPK